jgi:hypothetical protein
MPGKALSVLDRRFLAVRCGTQRTLKQARGMDHEAGGDSVEKA